MDGVYERDGLSRVDGVHQGRAREYAPVAKRPREVHTTATERTFVAGNEERTTYLYDGRFIQIIYVSSRASLHDKAIILSSFRLLQECPVLFRYRQPLLHAILDSLPPALPFGLRASSSRYDTVRVDSDTMIQVGSSITPCRRVVAGQKM